MTPVQTNPIVRLSRILAELSRRKVARVVGTYTVAVWLLAQGVADLFPAFNLPDWSVRAFVLAGVLGVPLVALLAWRYDLTPGGIKVDTGGPGDLSGSDRVPNDVAKWAMGRHDLAGTGHLCASWIGEDGTPHCQQFFEPLVIGRDVCNDIQLPDQRVSRRHTVLWAEKGTWCARDLDSSNGTYIDGNRIKSASLPSRCRMQLDRHGPVVELAVDTTARTVLSPEEKTTVSEPANDGRRHGL